MSDHAFVRPGQVGPDLPPPDNCVRCGQPEAAHGGSAELAARRTAAAAVLADYEQWYSSGNAADWPAWADRLAAELASLLEQLDAEDDH